MARRLLNAVLLSIGLAMFANAASADDVKFGPNDVRDIFHVRKSENDNRVYYGVRLDAQCRPVGKSPVFGYWIKHKNGGKVVLPLTGPATMVYGAGKNQKVVRLDEGGRVAMYVKAVDDMWVNIKITKTADGCSATPLTQINGLTALLDHAFVQLRPWKFGVRHVDIIGKGLKSGAKVVQRLDN